MPTARYDALTNSRLARRRQRLITDLNGDGKLDIATTNGGLAEGQGEAILGSNDISVLIGRGDGTFAKRVNVGRCHSNGARHRRHQRGRLA